MIRQAFTRECLYMKSLLLAYNNSGHEEELKKEAKYEKQIASIMASVVLLISAGVMTHKEGTHAESTQAAAAMAGQAQSSDKAKENGMEKIEKAYDLISNEYVEEVDRQKLLEGAIQGMLSTLNDPYSVYMDKQTAKQFSDSLDSSFEGIGAEVGMDEGKIIIVSAFKNPLRQKQV